MTIEIIGSDLMDMYNRGMDVYLAPGSDVPYWATSGRMGADNCILTSTQLVDFAGWEYGISEDELYESNTKIAYTIED